MTRSNALAAGLALALALAPGLAPASAFAAAASGQLLNGRRQFVDQNGAPIVGGAVHVYLPGTTTPASTFQDPDLSVANTNPIVLDGRGQATIWAAPGQYREQVYDAQGDLIWDETTSAIGSTVAALAPGAAIGAGGDVACPAQTFTGAAALTLSCSLGAGVVGNAKLAPAPAYTLKGNNTGAAASPTDLSPAQAVGLMAATGAQAGAGLSATTVLTPANFVGAGQAVGVNGYATLPGGLILQWGYYDCGSSGCYNGSAVTVSFPLAFPTGCFGVQATSSNPANVASPVYAMQVVSACAATSVSLAATGYQSGAHNSIEGFYWFALGH